MLLKHILFWEEKIIRDAVLDQRLTQRQIVEIEPYKIDNNRLIPQYPIRRPGTNPYARQATPPHRSRPRWQNRVADPVYGGEEAGYDG